MKYFSKIQKIVLIILDSCSFWPIFQPPTIYQKPLQISNFDRNSYFYFSIICICTCDLPFLEIMKCNLPSKQKMAATTNSFFRFPALKITTEGALMILVAISKKVHELFQMILKIVSSVYKQVPSVST